MESVRLSHRYALFLGGIFVFATFVLLAEIRGVSSLTMSLPTLDLLTYKLTHKYNEVLPTLPSFFRRYYEKELALPQHNEHLPFPEGENGRFLWVENQVWGTSSHCRL
jgi:hypothetical protein